MDRDSHIKSEPEANLDVDVASHMLTSDMLPVVVLTKTIFKPNHSFAINTDDMSIKTENDLDFEDNSHMDETFRDADDNSDDNDEADQVNGAETAIDPAETFSDDDVILIENIDEPVLVNGSPSGARNTAANKPFVLPIVIKREPVDNYEAMASPVYSPTKTIKSEPLEETIAEIANEVERNSSPLPKRASLKNRKSKKSTHKACKERQHLVQIKQEPIDPDDVFRKSSTHDMGSAIVSLPTTNLLETTIKQEPIRPGYDDDFDPVLAMNIKREPGLDDPSSSKLPSLRLIISKKHGTLNSKLISAQKTSESVETSPKATKAKRVKDKRLYRKPALLAEKIRQEMIARMSKDKENDTTGPLNEDEADDFTVPVIARVLDANTISDLPLVRVKIEPKSPYHSPSNLDSEPISDELVKDHVHVYLQDPIDAMGYDPDTFNADSNATGRFSSPIDAHVCSSTVGKEQNNIGTDNEELNSLLDIDSLCGINPSVSDSRHSNEIQSNEGQSETKNSDCQNVLNHSIKLAGPNAANDDIMELADMTLSEFMKPTDESNCQTTLEATDFGDHPTPSTDLIATSFDPIPFNETQDPNYSINQNSFKMPDEKKVSYEEINEIISALPLSVEPNVIEGVHSNNESPVVVNSEPSASGLLSPKETADDEHSALSDSSKSNEINSSNVNSHSSDESHANNSGARNETLVNDTLKPTDAFLANGCGGGSGGVNDDDAENVLLKSPVHENTDYELNSVQTLTTSAIHEQLHSLLEDISEDSLSCDIDLDDKTVDWEWESKLLGD